MCFNFTYKNIQCLINCLVSGYIMSCQSKISPVYVLYISAAINHAVWQTLVDLNKLSIYPRTCTRTYMIFIMQVIHVHHHLLVPELTFRIELLLINEFNNCIVFQLLKKYTYVYQPINSIMGVNLLHLWAYVINFGIVHSNTNNIKSNSWIECIAFVIPIRLFLTS